MIIQKQLFKHDPDNGVIGDCHRTAIACLLDLQAERVPHFGQEYWENSDKFHESFENWLNEQGYSAFQWYADFDEFDDLCEWMYHLNPNAYWILGCMSSRGTDHSIVMKGGQIVCEPAIDADPIPRNNVAGPTSNGMYGITVLIPLNMTGKVDK